MTMPAVELRKPFELIHQEEELTKQQQLQMDALRSIDPLVVSEAEFHLAAQLAHCASQHHASEYNIVKFGPHGSPTTYVPLSVHLPSHIKELKRRQSIFADQDPWWLASPSSPSTRDRVRSPQMVPKRAPATHPEDTEVEMVIEESITSSSRIQSPKGGMLELAEDAIPCPNPLPVQLQSVQPALKTSHSHPINISPIIPHELLPIISSHLQPSDIDVPTVFDLPLSMKLDVLTMPPSRSYLPIDADGFRTRLSPFEGPNMYNSHFFKPPPPPPQVIWNSNSPTSPVEAIESPLSRPWTCPPSQPVQLEKQYSKPKSTTPSQNDYTPQPFLTPLPIPLLPVSSHSHTPPPTPAPPIRSPPTNTTQTQPQSPSSPSISALNNNPRRFPPTLLGNIMLSSCPGKKVRLKGPVKGRGAICRDLGTDLERIAEMGIRCIVCCLDDDELDFLGVKWTDYAHLARQNGVDILRVPMPEGLTPHAIAPFNYALDVLIQRYTLQGIPVLVHCRGGVGRAGLVACCWMIKVGLCGWMEGFSLPDNASTPSINGLIKEDFVPAVPVVPSQAYLFANGNPREPLDKVKMRCNGTHSTTSDLLTRPESIGCPSPTPSASQSQTFSFINNSSLLSPITPSAKSGILTPFLPASNCSTPPLMSPTPSKVSPETLDLVQKVIAVARRRRSVKAIETYEQVKFLVEFVEFLRNGSLKNGAPNP